MSKPFRFKQFAIFHDECAMKVGTDGVLIGAWADVAKASSILDIGTGTGLIAIMAAQKNEFAQIYGIDIDESAYFQALKNVNLCPWKERIGVKKIALQDFQNQNGENSFDAIITNPPYFVAGTKAPVQKRHIARHVAMLPHVELLKSVEILLSENGKFSIILPYQEGNNFQKLATEFSLYLTRICEVRSKKGKPVERLLMEFKKEEIPIIRKELIIQYEARNSWTPDYIELTKAFYLKM